MDLKLESWNLSSCFFFFLFEDICFIWTKNTKRKSYLRAEEWFEKKGMVTSDSDGNTTLTRGLHFLKNVKLWNLDVERHRRIILFEWFSNCVFGTPFPNHHAETPTEQRRARHFMEISIWRIPEAWFNSHFTDEAGASQRVWCLSWLSDT